MDRADCSFFYLYLCISIYVLYLSTISIFYRMLTSVRCRWRFARSGFVYIITCLEYNSINTLLLQKKVCGPRCSLELSTPGLCYDPMCRTLVRAHAK